MYHNSLNLIVNVYDYLNIIYIYYKNLLESNSITDDLIEKFLFELI